MLAYCSIILASGPHTGGRTLLGEHRRIVMGSVKAGQILFKKSFIIFFKWPLMNLICQSVRIKVQL